MYITHRTFTFFSELSRSLVSFHLKKASATVHGEEINVFFFRLTHLVQHIYDQTTVHTHIWLISKSGKGCQSKFVTNNIFNLQYICRVTPLVWIVFVLALMTVHMYCPWWVLLSCVRCNVPSLLLYEFGPVHLYVHCQHWAEHVTSKLPVSYLMHVSLAGLNDISSGPSENIHNWMLIDYHERQQHSFG